MNTSCNDADDEERDEADQETCADVLILADENGPGIKVRFHNPKRLLYPPKAAVHLAYFNCCQEIWLQQTDLLLSTLCGIIGTKNHFEEKEQNMANPTQRKKALSNRNPGKKKRFFFSHRLRRMLLTAFLFISLVATVSTYTIVDAYLDNAPKFDPNIVMTPPETPFIFDRNGVEIAKLSGAQNRILVPLDRISPYLIQAFIAIEDERFYRHIGFDPEAFMRAVYATVRERDFGVQGGSTITQQLAKTAFLTHDKTIGRKIQELYLAFHLERSFTKDEILEFYLNLIFFDFNAYGVEAAARTYFGKSAADVTLAEAAMLAGIPNLPGRYSPRRNLDEAQKRQRLILSRMAELGKITRGDVAQALQETEQRIEDDTWLAPLPKRPFPFFTDHVKLQVMEILSNLPGYEDSLYRGGLRIYTTLDPRTQQVAEDTLNNDRLYPRTRTAAVAGQPLQPQAAVLVADPQTGHIKALVGGRHYERGVQLAFNRAVAATRPAGSVLKPIMAYAPAFEERLAVPSTILDDAPAIWQRSGQPDYAPENFANVFEGLVTARYALIRSLNLPAIRLFEQLGIEKGMDYAARMGISTLVRPGPGRANHDYNLPAVVGGLTTGLRVIDTVQAYAVLANQGIRTNLVSVLRIEDRNGKVLYEHTPRSEAVLSPEAAYLTTNILQDVVRVGTATRLRIGRPVAAKTGTSDNSRDGWLAAYTPDIVAVFWIGYDKNDGAVPRPWQLSPAFLNPIMIAAHEGLAVREFPRPASISPAIAVCNKSGKRPGPYCPPANIVSDFFPHDQLPTEICDIHVEVEVCRDSGRLATQFCPPGSTIKRVFLNRPAYLTTDARWKGGPVGRVPADARQKPPTAPCNIHTTSLAAPRDVSAQYKQDGTILLSWLPSDGQQTGFLIHRQSPGQTAYQPLTAEPVAAFSFIDSVTAPGVYSYRVFAVNAQGVRSPAVTVTVTAGETATETR
ncbi:MAG: PBP1A family penicillin-binding protein [Dethiobacter sp.]|nr:PBP1A family penicillin-binding protein [Dethiobacter sp.]